MVVVGSGDSIRVGMPSLPDIDRYLKTWSAHWVSRLKLPRLLFLIVGKHPCLLPPESCGEGHLEVLRALFYDSKD